MEPDFIHSFAPENEWLLEFLQGMILIRNLIALS